MDRTSLVPHRLEPARDRGSRGRAAVLSPPGTCAGSEQRAEASGESPVDGPGVVAGPEGRTGRGADDARRESDPGTRAGRLGISSAAAVAGRGRLCPGNRPSGNPRCPIDGWRSGVGRAGSRGRYATALPSPLALAASWDLRLADDYGALLGKECRELGFQISLGGTANLVREPRNGRNFECFGEDPILIGKMIARELKATQAAGSGREHQSLCPERPGDGPHGTTTWSWTSGPCGKPTSGVRDRHQGIGRRDGDGRLQPRQRRLRLRKQLPAERCAQEGRGASRAGSCRTGAPRTAR